MKPCEHIPDELSAYLDGEASQAICDEIERHLAECENCRVLVDTLRQTIYLYRTLPQPNLPEKVRESLYKKLALDEFRLMGDE
ncbi:MAG: zf-HC2 domain-containing protein [Anaerolineae bacterium]|nr:zf-HC2 domain-containing protein [Anaerolineae bacterium]